METAIRFYGHLATRPQPPREISMQGVMTLPYPYWLYLLSCRFEWKGVSPHGTSCMSRFWFHSCLAFVMTLEENSVVFLFDMGKYTVSALLRYLRSMSGLCYGRLKKEMASFSISNFRAVSWWVEEEIWLASLFHVHVWALILQFEEKRWSTSLFHVYHVDTRAVLW